MSRPTWRPSLFFLFFVAFATFPQKLLRLDRSGATTGNSADPQHPRFCLFSAYSVRLILVLFRAVSTRW